MDSIESGKKHRREGKIGISSGVRCTEFDALCFRAWRIGRNSNGGGAIAGRISEIDRRFEPGNEPLVAVGSWVRQAGERRRMFQNPANEKERRVAEAGITVPRKKRLFGVPK